MAIRPAHTPIVFGVDDVIDDVIILNKANLRDLIAATGTVILLKLDSNRRFLGAYDLENEWVTSQDNRPPVLCYVKAVHYFKTTNQLKFELQSGNAQFGSKLAIFFVSC